MNSERTHELRSPAIGQRITAIRYTEAGYVVIDLEDDRELWISAD